MTAPHVTNVSKKHIHLKWYADGFNEYIYINNNNKSTTNNNSRIVLFIIERRSNDSSSKWSTVVKTTKDAFIDSPATSSSSSSSSLCYQYRVWKVTGEGFQSSSASSPCVHLVDEPFPPGPPEKLSEDDILISEGNPIWSVSWAPPRHSDLPIYKYNVIWFKKSTTLNSLNEPIAAKEDSVSANQHQFHLQDLEQGESYIVQVQAVSQFGTKQLKGSKSTISITVYPLPNESETQGSKKIGNDRRVTQKQNQRQQQQPLNKQQPQQQQHDKQQPQQQHNKQQPQQQHNKQQPQQPQRNQHHQKRRQGTHKAKIQQQQQQQQHRQLQQHTVHGLLSNLTFKRAVFKGTDLTIEAHWNYTALHHQPHHPSKKIKHKSKQTNDSPPLSPSSSSSSPSSSFNDDVTFLVTWSPKGTRVTLKGLKLGCLYTVHFRIINNNNNNDNDDAAYNDEYTLSPSSSYSSLSSSSSQSSSSSSSSELHHNFTTYPCGHQKNAADAKCVDTDALLPRRVQNLRHSITITAFNMTCDVTWNPPSPNIIPLINYRAAWVLIDPTQLPMKINESDDDDDVIGSDDDYDEYDDDGDASRFKSRKKSNKKKKNKNSSNKHNIKVDSGDVDDDDDDEHDENDYLYESLFKENSRSNGADNDLYSNGFKTLSKNDQRLLIMTLLESSTYLLKVQAVSLEGEGRPSYLLIATPSFASGSLNNNNINNNNNNVIGSRKYNHNKQTKHVSIIPNSANKLKSSSSSSSSSFSSSLSLSKSSSSSSSLSSPTIKSTLLYFYFSFIVIPLLYFYELERNVK
ncbi:hypothetical protein HELRODRAFT_189718 [Helobdella robusta]|uniref:Fibronectin type-III domain-containing protein n=1 Tax=Helobdella robusta TaxID=6412 RepID=T1FRA5_HELRO|nr:hypothetical protein HELRODRAFT_189718 [Helobdella robusta]ESN91545.1 hypothetical protein HELRODRAFT_189718 [Helobdella robusta]